MDMSQLLLMVFTFHLRRVPSSLDITTFGSKVLENAGMGSSFWYIYCRVNMLCKGRWTLTHSIVVDSRTGFYQISLGRYKRFST
jgi:hypothetical protein